MVAPARLYRGNGGEPSAYDLFSQTDADEWFSSIQGKIQRALNGDTHHSPWAGSGTPTAASRKYRTSSPDRRSEDPFVEDAVGSPSPAQDISNVGAPSRHSEDMEDVEYDSVEMESGAIEDEEDQESYEDDESAEDEAVGEFEVLEQAEETEEYGEYGGDEHEVYEEGAEEDKDEDIFIGTAAGDAEGDASEHAEFSNEPPEAPPLATDVLTKSGQYESDKDAATASDGREESSSALDEEEYSSDADLAYDEGSREAYEEASLEAYEQVYEEESRETYEESRAPFPPHRDETETGWGSDQPIEVLDSSSEDSQSQPGADLDNEEVAEDDDDNQQDEEEYEDSRGEEEDGEEEDDEEEVEEDAEDVEEEEAVETVRYFNYPAEEDEEEFLEGDEEPEDDQDEEEEPVEVLEGYARRSFSGEVEGTQEPDYETMAARMRSAYPTTNAVPGSHGERPVNYDMPVNELAFHRVSSPYVEAMDARTMKNANHFDRLDTTRGDDEVGLGMDLPFGTAHLASSELMGTNITSASQDVAAQGSAAAYGQATSSTSVEFTASDFWAPAYDATSAVGGFAEPSAAANLALPGLTTGLLEAVIHQLQPPLQFDPMIDPALLSDEAVTMGETVLEQQNESAPQYYESTQGGAQEGEQDDDYSAVPLRRTDEVQSAVGRVLSQPGFDIPDGSVTPVVKDPQETDFTLPDDLPAQPKWDDDAEQVVDTADGTDSDAQQVPFALPSSADSAGVGASAGEPLADAEHSEGLFSEAGSDEESELVEYFHGKQSNSQETPEPRRSADSPFIAGNERAAVEASAHTANSSNDSTSEGGAPSEVSLHAATTPDLGGSAMPPMSAGSPPVVQPSESADELTEAGSAHRMERGPSEGSEMVELPAETGSDPQADLNGTAEEERKPASVETYKDVEDAEEPLDLDAEEPMDLDADATGAGASHRSLEDDKQGEEATLSETAPSASTDTPVADEAPQLLPSLEIDDSRPVVEDAYMSEASPQDSATPQGDNLEIVAEDLAERVDENHEHSSIRPTSSPLEPASHLEEVEPETEAPITRLIPHQHGPISRSPPLAPVEKSGSTPLAAAAAGNAEAPGSTSPTRPASSEGSRPQPQYSRPVTRSRCGHHKLRVSAGELEATLLVPQCAIDVSKLGEEDAADLGPSTPLEEEVADIKLIARLNPVLSTRFSRIVGHQILESFGHCAVLTFSEGAIEVPRDIRSRSISTRKSLLPRTPEPFGNAAHLTPSSAQRVTRSGHSRTPATPASASRGKSREPGAQPHGDGSPAGAVTSRLVTKQEDVGDTSTTEPSKLLSTKSPHRQNLAITASSPERPHTRSQAAAEARDAPSTANMESPPIATATRRRKRRLTEADEGEAVESETPEPKRPNLRSENDGPAGAAGKRRWFSWLSRK